MRTSRPENARGGVVDGVVEIDRRVVGSLLLARRCGSTAKATNVASARVSKPNLTIDLVILKRDFLLASEGGVLLISGKGVLLISGGGVLLISGGGVVVISEGGGLSSSLPESSISLRKVGLCTRDEGYVRRVDILCSSYDRCSEDKDKETHMGTHVYYRRCFSGLERTRARM